jgi:Flp pilus assembly CpaF family ATPase
VTWQSPVAEIERAVQDRATTAAIDMKADGSHDRLRSLVEGEVALWRQEFRRGRRSIDIADPDHAIERALRNLIGYGPLETLLDDPDVWEIMVEAVPTRGLPRKSW